MPGFISRIRWAKLILVLMPGQGFRGAYHKFRIDGRKKLPVVKGLVEVDLISRACCQHTNEYDYRWFNYRF